MGDLTIDQDIGHHRRRWLFQRVGFVAMALFILAAFVGLLGPGPLSHKRIVAPDSSFSVDYRRFEHRESATELRVSIPPKAGEEKVALQVARSFADRIELDHVVPEPESVELGDEFMTFRFRRSSLGVGGEVAFDYEYESMGGIDARIGLEGGPMVAFRQFVYP
jgi:hypothetical protein